MKIIFLINPELLKSLMKAKTAEKVIKIKRYVLTGAPGIGKKEIMANIKAELDKRELPTCLLNDVAKYIVESEIKKKASVEEYFKTYESQMHFFRVQCDFEEIKGKSVERTLQNKGIPDQKLYMELKGFIDTDLYKMINERIKNEKYRYSNVFLLLSNNPGKKDIEYKISHTYQECGYSPIIIEKTNLKDKIDSIINHIE